MWWGWFESQVVTRVDAPAQVEHREADLPVRYLFSVAAGMCSTHCGEPEIVQQVRTAWMTAQAANASDAPLDPVFRRAPDPVAVGQRRREAIDGDRHVGARSFCRSSGDRFLTG